MTNATLIDAHATLRQLKSFGVPGPYRILAPLSYGQLLVDEMRASGVEMRDPWVGACVEIEFAGGDVLTVEIAEVYRG